MELGREDEQTDINFLAKDTTSRATTTVTVRKTVAYSSDFGGISNCNRAIAIQAANASVEHDEVEEELLPFALAPMYIAEKAASNIEPNSEHSDESMLLKSMPLDGILNSPEAILDATSCYMRHCQKQYSNLPDMISSVLSDSQSSSCDGITLESTSNSSNTTGITMENRKNCSMIYESHMLDAAASLIANQSTTNLIEERAELCSQSHNDDTQGFESIADDGSTLHYRLKSQTSSNSQLSVLLEERSVLSVASSSCIDSSTVTRVIASEFRVPLNTFEQRSERSFNSILSPCGSATGFITHTVASAQTPAIMTKEFATLVGVRANRTASSSFQAIIELTVPSSGNESTGIHDVMDVLANPEMLRLWCDPIMSVAPVVITNRSEHARMAGNWHGGVENFSSYDNSPINQREYEGEWIEATTTAPLVEPFGCSTCDNIILRLRSAHQFIVSFMGCPTYGKISMFAERQKGHVSLNIGTFAGGIEINHKIRVIALESEKASTVCVVDDVSLHRDNQSSLPGNSAYSKSSSLFSGLVNFAEQFYLPKMEDYMNQVVRSLVNLRSLIENGASVEMGERNLSVYDDNHLVLGSLSENLNSPLLQQHHIIV